MQIEMKILVVEDHSDQVEIYQDLVEDKNKELTDIKIVLDIKNNLEDGLVAIRENDYDSAILDLKLGENDSSGKGNEMIRNIKERFRFPIRVISGYPQDLEKQFKEYSGFITVHKKDDNIEEIFDQIIKLYKTGITNVMGAKGKIESFIQNVFWSHLSQTVDFWLSEQEKIEDTEKIILRYTMAHLQEHLELNDTQSEFEKFLPLEMYIIPPIKSNYFTGDILNKDDKNFIILNPACDMAQQKAKWITIAEIEAINMPYMEALKQDVKAENEKSAQAKETITKLIGNSGSLKYHFLPETHNFTGGFINFQKISTVKKKDLSTYTRVASITDRFVKDIIARFSHYYSRQGQPDFDSIRLVEELFK